MRPSLPLVTLFALVAPVIAACDSPPSPNTVRNSISNDLGYVLRETDAAITQSSIGDLPSRAALSLVKGRVAALVSSDVADALDAVDDTGTIDPDALTTWLNEHLFTDANYIGDGVYEVPPALVCGEVTTDTSCADAIEQLALRVRTESDGDAIVFALQLAADHDEPLSVRLDHRSLAVTLALDEVERALAALASQLGAAAPNAELAGALTAKLDVIAPATVDASITIDRALSIRLAGFDNRLDSPHAFALSSAVADALEISINGPGDTTLVSLDLGETRIKMPQDDGIPVELELPGLTAKLSVTDSEHIVLTGVGLGDRTTKIRRGAAVAQAIDINAQSGRTFDVTIMPEAAPGFAMLTVPKLELALTTDHEVIGDEPPVYDVTRVSIAGTLTSTTDGALISVIDGSFGITTDPASYGVSATTGQFVFGNDEIDPDTGRSFTRWTVEDTCLVPVCFP